MLGMAQCFEAPKSGSALNHFAGTSVTQTASQGYPLYISSGVALNVYSKAQIKFHLLRAEAKPKSKPLQKLQANYIFEHICFLFASSICKYLENRLIPYNS